MDLTSGQARSYTCGFCKRGFSNAQALGGHMNIHRRDRAKLRQSLEENLPSLDMSMKNTTTDHHEPRHSEQKILFGLDSGDDDQQKVTSNHKKPCNFPEMDAYDAIHRGKKGMIGTSELPQFPLLVGMRNYMNESIEEKRIDVDLELRLGPEPQGAPTLSTREFF